MATFPRGTTPTLKFTLPFEAKQLTSVYITFAQSCREVLTKHGAEITAEGNQLVVELSQDETLLFRPQSVDIQIRAIDVAGNAIASKIITADVSKILRDGVIE